MGWVKLIYRSQRHLWIATLTSLIAFQFPFKTRRILTKACGITTQKIYNKPIEQSAGGCGKSPHSVLRALRGILTLSVRDNVHSLHEKMALEITSKTTDFRAIGQLTIQLSSRSQTDLPVSSPAVRTTNLLKYNSKMRI